MKPTVELVAVQLHEEKARVLEFATVNRPVMYSGIEVDVAVATKVDRCTKKDARFLSEKLTSIAILA